MNKRLVKDYAAKMTAELRIADPRAAAVTPSDAEAEIVRVMYHVVKVLAPTYRFGYHSLEDIEQEGIMEALEVLETDKYDITRPLENFLYTHIHHRLYNFRRKHYQRLEAPCKCCSTFDPPAYPCQKYIDWKSRNVVKQNLMKPLDMGNISDESEMNMRDDSEVVNDTIVTELRTLIDREMPVELRRDYLQMLDGKVVPKGRRERVREAVISITKDKGYLEDYEYAQQGETDRQD